MSVNSILGFMTTVLYPNIASLNHSKVPVQYYECPTPSYPQANTNELTYTFANNQACLRGVYRTILLMASLSMGCQLCSYCVPHFWKNTSLSSTVWFIIQNLDAKLCLSVNPSCIKFYTCNPGKLYQK